MAYTYQTLSDGTVQVEDASGGWTTPWPNQAEQNLFDAKVARWFDLASAAGAKYGVPWSWILAIIYSESGGDPNAHGPPSDPGIGLMMITYPGLKKGYTDAQVYEPEINIDIGVGRVIAPDMAQVGNDLPQIASMFNAGSPGHGAWPSPSAPWGWREYKIPSTGEQPYISKVVRINNYALSSLGGQQPAPPPDTGDGTDNGAGPAVALALAGLFGLWLWRQS